MLKHGQRLQNINRSVIFMFTSADDTNVSNCEKPYKLGM